MLYAILAYHVEAEVMSWTPQQDASVMTATAAINPLSIRRITLSCRCFRWLDFLSVEMEAACAGHPAVRR